MQILAFLTFPASGSLLPRPLRRPPVRQLSAGLRAQVGDCGRQEGPLLLPTESASRSDCRV